MKTEREGERLQREIRAIHRMPIEMKMFSSPLIMMNSPNNVTIHLVDAPNFPDQTHKHNRYMWMLDDILLVCKCVFIMYIHTHTDSIISKSLLRFSCPPAQSPKEPHQHIFIHSLSIN